MKKLVSVKTWKETENSADDIKSNSVFFIVSIRMTFRKKQLTGLGQILYDLNAYNVCFDFPKGIVLRGSKIPIPRNKFGRFLEI